MANHKKHPNRNRRAHCHMCKYWKDDGRKKHKEGNAQMSDVREFRIADEAIKEYKDKE